MRVEEINPYAEGDKTEQVRDMFDSIAPAYDFMNNAMSFRLHRRWLRRAVREVAAKRPSAILDVATGTADVAIALACAIPSATVTGIDLSQGMLDRGAAKVRQAALDGRIHLQQADCLQLPFGDDSFDAVTVAYGVRNFSDLRAGYAQMHRVLCPGGTLTVIELSTPRSPLVRPFYNFYTRCIIPLMGRLVSRDVRAYSYLPQSIAAVPQGRQMTALMEEAGFRDAGYHCFWPGVCTLYTATK